MDILGEKDWIETFILVIDLDILGEKDGIETYILVMELDILGEKDWIETHILEGRDFTYEATPWRSLCEGLDRV